MTVVFIIGMQRTASDIAIPDISQTYCMSHKGQKVFFISVLDIESENYSHCIYWYISVHSARKDLTAQIRSTLGKKNYPN